MDTYVYGEYGNLYINLTNQCSNACDFCVRNSRDGVESQYLWLAREPYTADIIASSPQNLDAINEIVFCGYGEPTYRLETLIEVAGFFKGSGKKIRLNTNGHSDLINNKKTAPLFKGLIDTVSVSLNASDESGYERICKPVFKGAFEAMLSFAQSCVREGIETIMSVVDVIGEEEISKCRILCGSLGLTLRVRKFITP